MPVITFLAPRALRRDRDGLGSVVATYKDGWLTADRSYDPYGETRAEWNDVGRFGWVGGLGYRGTRREWVSHYVRARHYGYPMGMWTSVDPLWPEEAAFGYVGGMPVAFVDPSGLSKIWVQMCAYISRTRAIYKHYFRPFAGSPVLVNTNDLSYGDPISKRLSCKLFVQVTIPSCSIGVSDPNLRVEAGVTEFYFNGAIDPARGVARTRNTRTNSEGCTSEIWFEISGRLGTPTLARLSAAVGMLFASAPPIVVKGYLKFSAFSDVVTVEGGFSHTAFPDWTFRIGTGASAAWGIDWKSPHAGPGTGLTALSVSHSLSKSPFLRAQTRKCCGGSCS